MATRSRIGIQNPDGTIHSVYCHWDGYLSNNGRILLRSYMNEDDILELISKGDMSYLDDSVAACNYYKDNNKSIASKSEEEYIKEGEEYNYLFKDGEWYYSYGNKEFVKLTMGKINQEICD